MWAIESTGISSIHILHSNRRWADLASWVRCPERARSSSSYSRCRCIAYIKPSSRSTGRVGGLPWRPSVRSNPEPAKEDATLEVDEVDALEEDGYEKRVDDDGEEGCLGGVEER